MLAQYHFREFDRYCLISESGKPGSQLETSYTKIDDEAGMEPLHLLVLSRQRKTNLSLFPWGGLEDNLADVYCKLSNLGSTLGFWIKVDSVVPVGGSVIQAR